MPASCSDTIQAYWTVGLQGRNNNAKDDDHDLDNINDNDDNNDKVTVKCFLYHDTPLEFTDLI